MIPDQYKWLLQIPVLPKMVAEGLKLMQLNTKEIPGAKSNPVIMQLAKEAEVDNIYKNDDTAWCAVAHSALALRAGKDVPFKGYDRLRASSFAKFGSEVVTPVLGDTVVFVRPGGGHVGTYIAEDEKAYHVMGGNQKNEFRIDRIDKKRCTAIRRPIYKSGIPTSATPRYVAPSGISLSQNES